MRGFVAGLTLGLFLMACATTEPPKRDFEVMIYQGFSDTQTIERKFDDGSVNIIRTDSTEFDKYVCMTPEDYAKERKYQELLKKSCQAWR